MLCALEFRWATLSLGGTELSSKDMDAWFSIDKEDPGFILKLFLSNKCCRDLIYVAV